MKRIAKVFLALILILVPLILMVTAIGTPGLYIGQARADNLIRFFALLFFSLLVFALSVAIYRYRIKRAIVRATDWVRTIRLGQTEVPDPDPIEDFDPLLQEVNWLVKNLIEARAAAEEEARLRTTGESVWTPDRLKEHVRNKLKERALFVVSNREPYMHVRKNNQVECIVPASGLVTALEPILRACGGTWVANAGGDADRENTGPDDKLAVPPEEPQYTLRRVWITKEEEEGYYYGFSNEGLWPLCHNAHARPEFKSEDWEYYKQVNEKFAKALLEEMEGTEDPFVLIQDYHFALLPKLIKDKRPDARVALFWHIPWPNPESFGICPWQREILTGMLGSDLIGFHIQYHCNNFLDTVDRYLESRLDWGSFTVNRLGQTTYVKPYPISVAFTSPVVPGLQSDLIKTKQELFDSLGVKAEFMGMGVDRIDYTKGIVERFRGIERFLDKYPDYVGRFTFVELGAPSRTAIKRYQDLVDEVESETERINNKFQTRDWKPIVFLKKHHSQKDIILFYKAADLCLVTSLHDGMNLVAKEFIAAREEDDGVLILSRFTGAARELQDAIIINPYDTEQSAEAIRQALEMKPKEQSVRMKHMKAFVRDNNIYRWGANLISALGKIRSPMAPTKR